MYLTYDEYAELGGTSWDEDSYEEAELRAEDILDELTLDRLRTVDWSRWARRVKRCALIVLEALPQLDAAYDSDVSGGRGLSSFSNGVDSLTFESTGQSEADEIFGAMLTRLYALLPVELCSACVGYGHEG